MKRAVAVVGAVAMLMVAVESPATAGGADSATRRVPQCEQKRASSGFALPQLVQYGIGDRLLSEPSAAG